MPIFTGRVVSATPMTLNTTASLADIATALAGVQPQASTRRPGWASTDDAQSNLGSRVSGPPQSRPGIEPARGSYPERLCARFYYWAHDSRIPNPTFASNEYVLSALDVFISGAPGSYLLLWSSTDTGLIGIDNLSSPDGAAGSLMLLMKGIDPGASISTNQSALALGGPDFFLWLANRSQSKSTIATDLKIANVVGVSSAETRTLSGLLRGRIDFSRTSFLTAVAEESELGPMSIEVKDEAAPSRVGAKVWADGSFNLNSTYSHFTSITGKEATKREAVLELAYRVIPLLRALYDADKDWSTTERPAMLRTVRLGLARHFSDLAKRP